jgi:hypothetical protein
LFYNHEIVIFILFYNHEIVIFILLYNHEIVIFILLYNHEIVIFILLYNHEIVIFILLYNHKIVIFILFYNHYVLFYDMSSLYDRFRASQSKFLKKKIRIWMFKYHYIYQGFIWIKNKIYFNIYFSFLNYRKKKIDKC